MLRFSSLAALAAAAVALSLVACGPATIASGGGGSSTTTTGGGGSGGGCDYGGAHYAVGDSFSDTDGCNSCSCEPGGEVACTLIDCAPTCEQAGGSCDPITPEFCQNGTIGDATQYSCGTGLGVGCCFPKPTCEVYPCDTEGQTRCTGGLIQRCGYNPQTNCALEWLTQAACPDGQSCNSDGSACVAPVTQCTQAAECGCGCTCTPQGVCGYCTGAIPDSCTTDDECGPSCNGFHCVAGKCAAPVCVPGQDQTCNELLSMSSFAGTCNADRTCTCKTGFTKQPDGKCAP